MGKCGKTCAIVSGVVGVLAIVLGVCLKWAILPPVVDSMVRSKLKLDPTNDETWEAWVSPPITPYMKFNFFKVLNAEDVKLGGRPQVTELGPFSYREVREKQNIVQVQETISYGSYIAYEFDREASCEECEFNTNVTVINPVIVMIDYTLEKIVADLKGSPIGGVYIKILGMTVDEFIDSVVNDVIESINKLIKMEDTDMYDDIVITGTPNDMIFEGVKSGTLMALNTYLTNRDNQDYPSFQTTLATGLGTGLTDLCKMMIIEDTADPDYSGILSLLYDLSSRIKVDPLLAGALGATGADTLDAVIYAIATDPLNPTKLIILINTILPIVIDPLLDSPAIPPIISLRDGTFGFFKGTNATKTWWKINSGKYNLDEYQNVIEFNGNTRLPDGWWDDFGPTPSSDASGMNGICHDIIGTDGLAFAPDVQEDAKLWLFNDQLCRSIWLEYVEDVKIKGITTKRFTPPNAVFNFSNPDNYCYCPGVRECAKEITGSDEWDMSACREAPYFCRDGMISLEGCQGAPVIMSTPHFLDGDPELAAAIDGINPVRELHETFLNLEPLSGQPMQAHKRIQISVPVLPSPRFDILNNVAENVFPLAWVDEGADIDSDPDLVKEAKAFLVTPFVAVDAVMGVLIALGCMLIMGSIVMWVRLRRAANCA